MRVPIPYLCVGRICRWYALPHVRSPVHSNIPQSRFEAFVNDPPPPARTQIHTENSCRSASDSVPDRRNAHKSLTPSGRSSPSRSCVWMVHLQRVPMAVIQRQTISRRIFAFLPAAHNHYRRAADFVRLSSASTPSAATICMIGASNISTCRGSRGLSRSQAPPETDPLRAARSAGRSSCRAAHRSTDGILLRANADHIAKKAESLHAESLPSSARFSKERSLSRYLRNTMISCSGLVRSPA